MNKQITIYELLGLIKDDKAPKKIKYEYLVYELTFERNDYYCKQEMRWFTSEINSLGVLNNKVEILEEDDLLKENCILKLCLISLLENFEKTEKSINDNNIKRYFKDLQKYIRKCLKLESKNNYIWDDLKRGDTNE